MGILDEVRYKLQTLQEVRRLCPLILPQRYLPTGARGDSLKILRKKHKLFCGQMWTESR